MKVTSSVAFGYAHLVGDFDKYRELNKDVELILELDDHIVNLNENDVDIALRITSTPPQNKLRNAQVGGGKLDVLKLTCIPWRENGAPKN